MSGRIYQSIILQMKDITARRIGVTDARGGIMACSDLSYIGNKLPNFQYVFSTEAPFFSTDGYSCHGFGGLRGTDYYVFAEGLDETARLLCSAIAVAMAEAKRSYDEKHDILTLVKNILTDNILPGDVVIRARELRFAVDTPRAVFAVRQTGAPDDSLFDYLVNRYSTKDREFVLSMSERDIVIIREISPHCDNSGLERMGEGMAADIQAAVGSAVVIGIGSPVQHLRQLATRYKEALTAIEEGKVFDDDKQVISYDNLGIGRIIYQLPTTLCEMFLREVFKQNTMEELDEEMLFTINKFFENNLNVSETARKLFVHRNTLVYRLEKIKKITGLDLREFDHAIMFKVALMVKRYMDSKGQSY